MTVAEIGCGQCIHSAGLRALTRNARRSRKHGIPFAGNEQESTSESPRIRLLSARCKVSPGIVNSKRVNRDFSRLRQRNPAYESPPIGNIRAGVWDLSSDQLPEDLEPESVDIAVLIFVLSALHPDEWFNAVKNVHRVWSPSYRYPGET